MVLTKQDLIRELLTTFGENPNREGLKETPDRVIKMYEELLSGYNEDIGSVFKSFDSESYTGIITIENIAFSSLCEHHLTPFVGTVDIMYKPNGKVLGLSKFGRMIEIFSKRLQLQERLTNQIAESLFTYLKPKGCVVTVRAEHMCMTMRGVKKYGSKTITTCAKGEPL